MANYNGKKNVNQLLFLACVLYGVNVYACSSAYEEELNESDLVGLIKTVNSQYSEISSAHEYRRLTSLSYGMPWKTIIDFKPHAIVNGEEEYYSLTCLYAMGDWRCKDIETLRSVSFECGAGYVKLENDISADEAMGALEYVASVAISGEDERVLKHNLDRILTKDDVDNILSIEKTSELNYTLSVKSHGCSIHKIEVEKIQCGMAKCDFRILSNRTRYYM